MSADSAVEVDIKLFERVSVFLQGNAFSVLVTYRKKKIHKDIVQPYNVNQCQALGDDKFMKTLISWCLGPKQVVVDTPQGCVLQEGLRPFLASTRPASLRKVGGGP